MVLLGIIADEVRIWVWSESEGLKCEQLSSVQEQCIEEGLEGGQLGDCCSDLGVMSPRTKVAGSNGKQKERKERHCEKKKKTCYVLEIK